MTDKYEKYVKNLNKKKENDENYEWEYGLETEFSAQSDSNSDSSSDDEKKSKAERCPRITSFNDFPQLKTNLNTKRKTNKRQKNNKIIEVKNLSKIYKLPSKLFSVKKLSRVFVS